MLDLQEEIHVGLFVNKVFSPFRKCKISLKLFKGVASSIRKVPAEDDDRLALLVSPLVSAKPEPPVRKFRRFGYICPHISA